MSDTGINTEDNTCTNDTANQLKFDVLKNFCENNAKYFATDSSENGQRLYLSFMAIRENLNLIEPKIQHVESRIAEFDYDENTLGNGYRSFLTVVYYGIDYCTQLSKKICLKRDSPFFRKTQLTKEIECCAHLIASLDTCLKHLETLLSWSSDGDLFPKEEHSPQELLANYKDINQYCFYGRCLGFQYCEALRNILNFIVISMAVFSEMYYNRGSFISKATNSVIATSKFVNDPEERARRIVNISQNAGVDFCKSFWFLSENDLLTNFPNIVSPNVAISKIIQIPSERLILNINNRDILIPIPTSHIGEKPIKIRLISYNIHDGMVQCDSKNRKPSARCLLFHCHGGGFVSQSSLSHESYLREWAKQLQIPIISVDYSLAPEAPYPRAIEEVFYAYCWILKNYQQFGTTGERIIAAGDSAGANLILATTLKCIQTGVPTPHGLFVAYVPTLINCTPSPARLLCMMDPLLPFGFLMRCLKAYALPTDHEQSDTESFEEISESDLMELQAHKSPISDTSDTLTYGSFQSNPGEDHDGGNKQNGSDMLEKYVLDSDTDTDGTRIPVLRKEYDNFTQSSSTDNGLNDETLQKRVTNFVTTIKNRFGNWFIEKTQFMTTTTTNRAQQYLDIEKSNNLLDEFQFVVPNDPYLSPYLMTDKDLSQFPPIRVLTTEFDPCLDDCVMFAKRLKLLNKDVRLDILNGLPHGFLNFITVSKEAFEGCKICIDRLNELLNLDNLPEQ